MRVAAETIVHASPEDACRFLSDVDRIVWYDERVGQVAILGQTGDGRTDVEVHGRFAGWPYHARFAIRPIPHSGYQAELVSGPIPWAYGRFSLTPVGQGTRITRVEAYRFGDGWSARLCERTWRRYVQRSILRELRLLKTLIEAEVGCRGIPTGAAGIATAVES